MARLPSLVAALTSACGTDPGRGAQRARVVREAGLISFRKRGVGAANMTLTDAVNLLIGFSAPVPSSHAANAARQYSTLRPHPGFQEKPFLPQSVLDAPTFGAAIAALITHAPSFAAGWDRIIAEKYGEQWTGLREATPAGTSRAPIALVVEMTTAPTALIRVDLNMHTGSRTVLATHFVVDATLMLRGAYGPDTSPHMTSITRLDIAPFLALHHALKKTGVDEPAHIEEATS